MSSPEPANEAFFADPAEPVTPEAQEAQPAPEPEATEAPSTPTATHESAAGAAAAMIDVPLGTLIFRAGLLGEEQLEDALREGMRTGQRLGEVLIGRGWLQERDLGRLLAGQKGLPFVEVSADDAEPAALDKLSEDNAKLQVALPLRYEGGQLVVAVADPSNELMLENLRRTLGAPPKLVVAPYAELVKAIAEAYARPRPEAPTEPEIAAVPDTPEPETPEPETQPEQQAEAQPAAARPLPIVLPPKKSASEPDTPQPEAQPEPEVERAPAPRPLPIMLRPKESAAESQPAPAPQPTPVPPPSVETPQVEEAAVYAIETTPAPEPTAPEQPAAQSAPDATPEPEPQAPADEAPPAPELILELPPDWPPTGEDQAEEPPAQAPPPTEAPAPEPPAQEEPEPPTHAPPPEAPAPEPPAQEDPVALTAVILRLTDGTLLEVGKFPTVAEAAAEAQEVVIEIAAADRNGGWPFFAQRYLRPDLIVSVDLIEHGSVPADGLRRSQR